MASYSFTAHAHLAINSSSLQFAASLTRNRHNGGRAAPEEDASDARLPALRQRLVAVLGDPQGMVAACTELLGFYPYLRYSFLQAI